MSGALTALSSIGGIAQQALPTLAATGILPAWIRAPRAITPDPSMGGGMIIPDVTIEETLSDRLTVTQHPIAKGSPISDHAYKLPATVTMRIGFSNSSIVQAAMSGFMSGGGFSDIGGGLAGAAGINLNATGIGDALTGGGLLGAATEQRCKEVYKQLQKLQFDEAAWKAGKVALMPFKLSTGKRDYKNMVMTELSVRTDRTSEYALMVECQMQEVFIVEATGSQQPANTDQAMPPKTAKEADVADKNVTPEATPPPASRLHDWFGPRPSASGGIGV